MKLDVACPVITSIMMLKNVEHDGQVAVTCTFPPLDTLYHAGACRLFAILSVIPISVYDPSILSDTVMLVAVVAAVSPTMISDPAATVNVPLPVGHFPDPANP